MEPELELGTKFFCNVTGQFKDTIWNSLRKDYTSRLIFLEKKNDKDKYKNELWTDERQQLLRILNINFQLIGIQDENNTIENEYEFYYSVEFST